MITIIYQALAIPWFIKMGALLMFNSLTHTQSIQYSQIYPYGLVENIRSFLHSLN